jgi:hypothetical protein
MTVELEKEEAESGVIEVLFRHLAGGTEENNNKPPVTIANGPAEIRAERFPNITTSGLHQPSQ